MKSQCPETFNQQIIISLSSRIKRSSTTHLKTRQTSTMLSTNLALGSLLLLVLCGSTVSRRADCTDRCCLFVENVPVKLKSLRASFQGIKSYYEDNDDLNSVLLDDEVEHNFKSVYGCHAVNDVLRFYQDTVLPAAMNDTKHEQFKSSIDNIGQTFRGLIREILTCKNYFSCKKRFDIKDIVTSYNGMEKRGMYKAMGELDVLFNYIEDYLVSKRRKH
ncbi:interleukin-10 [Alosa sapidissima]|uniref:interleukin-10 n=1 Tax=Alosa sapidissima TaxID=34773 RepID=UPI001C080F9A|nr:interleukin-10 [Alosa sapidissima]